MRKKLPLLFFIVAVVHHFNVNCPLKIPGNDELNNLTERPVTRKHVGEVGDDVEGGVDDIRHGQVDKEVVGHGAHSLVRHHDPDY